MISAVSSGRYCSIVVITESRRLSPSLFLGADYAPLARHITRETGLRYVLEMAEAAEVGDRTFLGALKARLKAWSMGRRDSVIGDTPAGRDPV
jgi:hypothetical protein